VGIPVEALLARLSLDDLSEIMKAREPTVQRTHGLVSTSEWTGVRTMLDEAPHLLLIRSGKRSWLKAWGVRVAQELPA
jgi:hypothetical protein